MEWIRILALLGVLNFCYQVIWRYRKLKKSGINVSQGNRGLKAVFLFLFLICFSLVFVSEMLIHTFQLSLKMLPQHLSNSFHSSAFIAIVGILMIIFSVTLLHFTLAAFKQSLRFGLNSQNIGKLITTGIFSFSRNPFFISIELLFTGIALVYSTSFFIGIAVLSIFCIHFFILKEERFMRKNYGQEYIEYSQKVRRYF